MAYEDFVQSQVLQPMGISRMRLGKTSPSAQDEAWYYSNEIAHPYWDPNAPPIDDPYGGFNLDIMAAHGGWVASASDLVRFAL